jgi:hypothetical protein
MIFGNKSSSSKPENKEKKNETEEKNNQYKLIYSIMHIIISLFAIYLSWKCNDGFDLMSFIVALMCPYLYIVWALATRGGCGIFESECTIVEFADGPTSIINNLESRFY